jgi:hypothetical protein
MIAAIACCSLHCTAVGEHVYRNLVRMQVKGIVECIRDVLFSFLAIVTGIASMDLILNGSKTVFIKPR